MISYALDAHLEGEWVEVAQGEFDDAHQAIEALDVFKNEFGYDTSELRIRRIERMDQGELKKCSDCGGIIVSGPEGLGCRDCGQRYIAVKRKTT